MERVFNLGVGMVVVVAPDDAYRAIDVLRGQGHAARQIGSVAPGAGQVRLLPAAGS
jgi:phosphoribosylformylglycinamidine cyclo-ligase